MIKHFLSEIGEIYTLQKKSNTPSDISKSQEFAINKVKETITSRDDNHTDRAKPLHDAAYKENLLSLFKQYSNLVSSNSDCLSTDHAIIINEVSGESISATYHVTVQQHATTALFDMGINMSLHLHLLT